MIIHSNVNAKSYQWIKIPRTGTTSYSRLFSPNVLFDGIKMHRHFPYNKFFTCKECVMDYNKIDAFTMVRHPVSRFKSSINFMAQRHNNSTGTTNVYNECDVCKNIFLAADETPDITKAVKFIKFYENEKTFYEFMYDNFNKNCEIKPGISMLEIFDTENSGLVNSFFTTQVEWAYHPKVKIFKYETVDEFNNWIETELGYDTGLLTRINISKKEIYDEINIDFTTDKFKKLVKHLFHDDFLYFNYEFPT